MTTTDLDRWFNLLLQPELFAQGDPSQNGIQVDNDGAEIKRVAFAVDACLASIEKAIQAGAGMLFVHHGLFWRDPVCIRGIVYNRVKLLIENNLALYASHLPLDAHCESGNNSGLVSRLGLINVMPFGKWKGHTIGFKGVFNEEAVLDDVFPLLFPDGGKPLHVLPFGPKKIHTIGIISGGGSDEVFQAIEEGLDLYITGEISHEIYHVALENKIHVIAGGHYQTETIGPRLLAERLGRETGIDTVFLDIPTGL